MKRYITIGFFLLFISSRLAAQETVGFKLGGQTTGTEFYLYMKNGWNVEAYLTYDVDNNLRLRATLQMNRFNPTYDTIHYTYESQGGYIGASYLPGYIVLESYSLNLGMIGADYYIPALYFKDKLRIYPGWDIFGGSVSRKYFEFDTYSTVTASDSYLAYGTRLRANVDFELGLYSAITFQTSFSIFQENKFNEYYAFYTFSLGYQYLF